MSRKKGLVHCIAHCQNCDWIAEGLKSAARKAVIHSRQTGHTVGVEQGYHYKIIGKSIA